MAPDSKTELQTNQVRSNDLKESDNAESDREVSSLETKPSLGGASISTDLGEFGNSLLQVGAGSKRSDLIQNKLKDLNDGPAPIKLSEVKKILSAIESTYYDEDTTSVGFFSPMSEIVKKLGLDNSLDLLTSLETKGLRRVLAGSVAELLLRDGKIVKNKLESIASLPEWDQLNVHGALGGEMHFRSVYEARTWIDSLGTSSGNNYKAAVEASLNSSRMLEPISLIDESLRIQDRVTSEIFFREGIDRYYQLDSLEASKFLLSKKDSIPDHLFKIGAEEIAYGLHSDGAFESAEQWKNIAK